MSSNLEFSKKIFIGITEISGYYTTLNQLFNKNGIKSDLFILFNHKFTYADPLSLPLIARFAQIVSFKYSKSNLVMKIILGTLHLVIRILLLIYSIFFYKVFIFSFGISLLPLNLDLFILKTLKKIVIFNMGHGSESRSLFLSHPNQLSTFSDIEIKKLLKFENQKIRNITFIERFATYVIGLPTTSHYFHKPLLNYQKIRSLSNSVESIKKNLSNESFIITHIPSNARIKGSLEIKLICEKLRNKYPKILYQELSNLSNKDTLSIYASSHLVIDQLWSDIPLSKTGIECAQLKVLCVSGSYAVNFWARFLEKEFFVPSFNYKPENMLSVLEDIYLNFEKFQKRNLILHDRVKEVWSSEKLLEFFISVFKLNVDNKYFFYPTSTDYFFGCGVSKAILLKRAILVRDYLNKNKKELNTTSKKILDKILENSGQ